MVIKLINWVNRKPYACNFFERAVGWSSSRLLQGCEHLSTSRPHPHDKLCAWGHGGEDYAQWISPCLKPPESPPESGDNYHVTNLWLQPQQFKCHHHDYVGTIDYLSVCRPGVTFMGIRLWDFNLRKMWDPYNYGYISRLWNCTPNYRLAI
jgi:hypothetical protein